MDGLFPAIETTHFRSSDPTLTYRSDLRYVPTLRTFLFYKCFLFGDSGSRGSGLTCRPRVRSPRKDRREKIAEKRSPRKDRREKIAVKRSPRKDRREKNCLFCRVKMTKCAYRFGAPDATMMVRTATSVLHEARTRCLSPCDGRNPAESGGHFGGESPIAEKRYVPASWQREKGGQHVATDSDVPLD